MQQRIFSILFDSDEITWQSLIYRLVKEEGMNPWDIDISLLTKKYVQMLNKLKDMDFRISGKVVLAAAILLKIKSSRLVGEDMSEFDRLIASAEADSEIGADEFYNQLEQELGAYASGIAGHGAVPGLVARTPQPRTRKVSIYDLMEALNTALEVRKRRVLRSIPAKKMTVPHKERDISLMIKQVYERVCALFSKGKKQLFFSELVPSESRNDKIYTFIPLLHLAKDRKIDLEQQEHFGPIEVLMPKQT